MKTLGLGALSATALGGYAFIVEPLWRLRVTNYALKPQGWTRGLKLKVAILADFHACNPWMSAQRIEKIVARTNALNPDIVLLLGDFSAGMRFATSYVDASEWAPILAGLSAPLGRYAVLGNHDWWEDELAQTRGFGPPFGQIALEKAGVPVLENAVVRLSHKGMPFWLAGLGDQLAFLPRRGAAGTRRHGVDDLPGTLAQANDGAPILLMAHEPDIFPQVRRFDRPVALTVSGHTHGGQFRIFGHSPVVPSRYGNRYAYGHIAEPRAGGGMCDLLVSGGLGCSIAPVRFGIPPEIVVLELS